MDPAHKQKTEWEGWPFTSMDEVADFASYLGEQVREVAESTGVSISVNYEDKEFKHLTLAEFKEQALALPLDSVVNLSICAGEFDRDAVIAWLFLFRAGMRTTLSIDGRKVTAVNHVKVRIDAEVKRLFKQKHEGESAAAATVRDHTAPPSRWRRWITTRGR